eukprot:396736-Prorocentrum_minimum.AAC.2
MYVAEHITIGNLAAYETGFTHALYFGQAHREGYGSCQHGLPNALTFYAFSGRCIQENVSAKCLTSSGQTQKGGLELQNSDISGPSFDFSVGFKFVLLTYLCNTSYLKKSRGSQAGKSLGGGGGVNGSIFTFRFLFFFVVVETAALASVETAALASVHNVRMAAIVRKADSCRRSHHIEYVRFGSRLIRF